LTEMDILGVTAQKANSATVSLSSVGWNVRSGDVAEIITKFRDITGISFPNSKTERAKWVSGVNDLLEEFGGGG